MVGVLWGVLGGGGEGGGGGGEKRGCVGGWGGGGGGGGATGLCRSMFRNQMGEMPSRGEDGLGEG